MFSLFQTRAKARALVGAVLAGALLGALVGGAYLAGIQAEAAEQRARIGPFAAAARNGYLLAARSPLPAKIALADNGEPPAASPPGHARPAAPFHLAVRSAGASDIDCLSAAVYYEARGETADGQAAVAQVVLNRARHPAYPKSVCGVVYQGAVAGACQFSFVCNGAMRGAREPGAWLRARAIAARALGGYVMAAVGRAVSFHAAGGGGASAAVARVGGHVFFGGGGRIAYSRPEAPKAEVPVASSVASAPNPTPLTAGVS